MSLDAQAKMLRVIEEGRLERVGSSSGRPIPVNVRILAATNKNLAEEIHHGRFREDLYHRLNVIPIFIPPLRDRREDIPMLVREFSKEFAAEMNRKPIRFDDAAMKLLTSLPFSGNIRELRNVIERIVILVPKEVVHLDDVEHLGLAFSMPEHSPLSQDGAPSRDVNFFEQPASDFALANPLLDTNYQDRDGSTIGRTDQYVMNAGETNPLDEAMQAQTFQDFKDRAEKAFIEEKLREQNWNISRTAEALDIQRSHLYTKMRKFGLMKDGRAQEIPPNEQDPEIPDEDNDDVL